MVTRVACLQNLALHETGVRPREELDVDRLPLWMQVQDIEEAVSAVAGTSEAIVQRQRDEGV